jgi:hypothetical protein
MVRSFNPDPDYLHNRPEFADLIGIQSHLIVYVLNMIDAF